MRIMTKNKNFIVRPTLSFYTLSFSSSEGDVYGFCECHFGHVKREVCLILKDISVFSQLFEITEHEGLHSAINECLEYMELKQEHNVLRRMQMFDLYETKRFTR